jgi:hypothetical protein
MAQNMTDTERIAALEAALKQNYLLATEHILAQPPDPTRNGAYLKLSSTMRALGLLLATEKHDRRVDVERLLGEARKAWRDADYAVARYADGLKEARRLALQEMVDGSVSAEDAAYNTAIRHVCDAIDDAIAKNTDQRQGADSLQGSPTTAGTAPSDREELPSSPSAGESRAQSAPATHDTVLTMGFPAEVELTPEQFARFEAHMREDREPTPAMKLAARQHAALVKAQEEGRLTLDTVQQILGDARTMGEQK